MYNKSIGNIIFPVELFKEFSEMRSKDPLLMDTIIRFAEQFYIKNGYSPTKAQIAKKLEITQGTVTKYLQAMRDKQMIEYDGYTIHTSLTKKRNNKHTCAAILGSVSCGPLQYEDENVEGFISLPEVIFGKGEFYILKANGDSMIGAGIDDGDWVVIKKQNYAKDSDIVVALTDGMNNLKYFFHSENGAVLRSANEKYEDIVVNDLSIQGIAVNIIKNI